MWVLTNNNTYIIDEHDVIIWNHVYTMGVLQVFMMQLYLRNTHT